MSITGHFGPEEPRAGQQKKGDGPILKGAKGPVLSGTKMPAEQLKEDAIQAMNTGEVFGVELPGRIKRFRSKYEDPCYWGVDVYDPVLMWHCRLVPDCQKRER